jgi:adenylate cyclase
MAEAWAAHWHLFYGGQGWAKDFDKINERAQHHALRAITLDPENAEALGIYAHCCSRIAGDFDRALAFFDRALRLNPSLAFNWALSAPTYCYIGEPDIALQRLKRYRELASPDLYFSWFETLYTIAYTFKGDYERAVLVGRRAVKANSDLVNGYKPLIASLGHLGERDEAQAYVRRLLSLEPNFTIERFGQTYPIKKPSDRDRYMEGLRLAGVPER